MTEPRWHYDRATLAEALRAAGVAPGDTVFSHVGLGMLGFPRGERTAENGADIVVGAYLDVLGDAGTWLVPAYSYTFTKGEVFDPAQTPSDIGPLSERARMLPGAIRSLDPLFSVAGIGPRAAELFQDLPHDCFGPDCLYERMTRGGVKIVNAGVGFRYATYIHHVEQMMRVPYRYPKLFTGTMRIDGAEHEETWNYNVRPLGEPGGDPDLRRLEAEAKRRGLLTVAPAGFGQITSIECADMWELCTGCVSADPWFLSRAGAEDWEGPLPAIRPEVDDAGAPLNVRIGADRV